MKQRRKMNLLWFFGTAIVINGLFLWKPVMTTCFMFGSLIKSTIVEMKPCQQYAEQCDRSAELEALTIENEALKLKLAQMNQLMNLEKEVNASCIYAKILHYDSNTGLLSLQATSESLKVHQAVISSSGYLGKTIQVFGKMAVVETLRSPHLSSELSVVLISDEIQIQAMITGMNNHLAEAVLLDESQSPVVGMRVLTSQFSQVPNGVSVGTVTDVFQDISKAGTMVLIQLSASYADSEIVCVVDN